MSSYQETLSEALEFKAKYQGGNLGNANIRLINFVTGEVRETHGGDLKVCVDSIKQCIHHDVRYKLHDDPIVLVIESKYPEIKKLLEDYLDKITERQGLKNESRMA